MSELSQLQQWIDESQRIVFFGGAGTSTGSGIPDFRSPQGLYADRSGGRSPEYYLSHTYFREDPEGFSRYYKGHLVFPDAKPRELHMYLAKLEQQGKLEAIITQNIDGLHQKAGNKKVIEIHGNLQDHYCIQCHKTYSEEEAMAVEGLFRCDCGGIVRPDVTLYEESLPQQAIHDAVQALEGADMLIVGGTSLVVWPAAGLIDYFRGNRKVIINQQATSRMRSAFFIQRDLNEVFGALV